MIEYTIHHVTDPKDLEGIMAVEQAAFEGAPMFAAHPPGTPPAPAAEIHAAGLAWHSQSLTEDPTTHYLVARLPDGRVIGFTRWHFFPTATPHNPWLPMRYPRANWPLCDWVFGAMTALREEKMRGKRHALAAELAVDPAYQRMGIGGKLFEWPLAKCDEEGLECWIDASVKGKGLYEKFGWKQVGSTDYDMKDWGGVSGSRSTAGMIRLPVKREG